MGLYPATAAQQIMQIAVDSTAPPPSVPRRVTLIAAGFLVAVGIFMAVSGDFSRPSSSTSTTPTELYSQIFRDVIMGPNDGPIEDCANVKDWNFLHATVTQNNLGGQGPIWGPGVDKQEIRYSNVADMIDLVLTVDGGSYRAVNSANNGIKDGGNGFGVVNIYTGTAVNMKFTLVEAGTDTPVQIAPDQTVFFTVFDMDSSRVSNEYVRFTTPVDSYKTTTSTTVQLSGDKNNLFARSGRFGKGKDNPSDPLALTQLQKDSAVYVSYKGRNTWSMTFGEDKTTWGGRNLLFAGRADGDCPVELNSIPMLM